MTYSVKIILISLLFFSSCDASKTTLKSNTKEDTTTNKQMDKTLINQGYSVGTIKYLEKSKCPYVIFDETTKVQLDPINFDDTKFAEFKKNNEKIYFKYRPLRRMNRCNDAAPVELEGIKKRAN